MVGETGCNQTNPAAETKAQWFLNVLTNYLPAVQPRNQNVGLLQQYQYQRRQ